MKIQPKAFLKAAIVVDYGVWEFIGDAIFDSARGAYTAHQAFFSDIFPDWRVVGTWDKSTRVFALLLAYEIAKSSPNPPIQGR